MASYYVNKSGKNGWRLIEQSYVKEGDKLKSVQTTVKKEAYRALGFNPDWSIAEAKERVKQLNTSNHEKRKENHSASRAANRYVELTKNASIYAPAQYCEKFIKQIEQESFGTEAHKSHLLAQFKWVQNMVKALKLEPHQYAENKAKIYHHYISECISLDYANKITRILNQWARFVCKDRGQYFEPVPTPKGPIRSKIEEAYLDSEDFRGESNPLTMAVLDKAKSKLSVKNYNWLFISIWFGLRPSEVTSLHANKNWKLSSVGNTEVLHVYMPKLTSLSRDKRWKLIPIIFDEQKQALTLIKSKDFKAPLLKTMHKHFHEITLYGGRKGFVDMMLDKGQKLEDISMWLGHQSIETTWRKYRNKKRVSWTA